MARGLYELVPEALAALQRGETALAVSPEDYDQALRDAREQARMYGVTPPEVILRFHIAGVWLYVPWLKVWGLDK